MRKIGLLISLSVSIIGFTQIDGSNVGTTLKFNEVLSYVNQMYVDDVNDEQLTEAAIVALLEKLDPHSNYISKEDVEDANERINGNFVGVGIRFQILKDTLMVVSTIPGGHQKSWEFYPETK